MGPKKGKSADEKKEVLLKIYHDTKQPFNLKEIEKEGSRAGVVAQTIKDINQSLVDDGLIQNDKIGSGVFFWSFPSKGLNDRTVQLKTLEGALERSRENIIVLTNAKRAAEQSRGAPERAAKLARLQSLREEETRLSALLELNKQNDPEELRRVQKAVEVNRESANRWVDNTYAVKKFLTKNKGVPSREADKYLAIDDSFDYFDESAMQRALKPKSAAAKR